MKHLKKYNHITKKDIENYFAHSFDLSDSFEISEAYFNPNDTRDWASNDFSNEESENHPNFCLKGFQISINNNIYELKDFTKYVELINQISEDINRFKQIEKPKDIFFDSNDPLIIIIAI